MTTAHQLLKEVATSDLDGFCNRTEAFLKVVTENWFGHEEAKLYNSFIQNCLHTLVKKRQGKKDAGQIEEVLGTAIVCGKAYIQLLPSLEKTDTHIVPSLLYHIVHNIQEKIHTFADHVVTISELAYNMLDHVGFSESGHATANAFYGCLWNSSSKFLKQGSSQIVKHFLRFRKMSLLFSCCQPLKQNNVVSMLQFTVAHYTKFSKDWVDKETSEIFYCIFQTVLDKLKSCIDKYGIDERPVCERWMVQIQAVLVEHLLKVSDFDRARQVTLGLSEACDNCSLYRSVADCYSYAGIVLEAMKNLQKPQISSKKLKNTNHNLKQDILSGEKEELKLLFGALVTFIQSFSTKGLDNLDTSLMKELIESCENLVTLCHKLQSGCTSLMKKTKDQKKQKVLTDENVEYVNVYLQTAYRELQFMHRLLETGADEELCTDCVSMAEKFQEYLVDNLSVLPNKNENAHRYNLGYICSMMAQAHTHSENHEVMISLYKVAVNQFIKCQQPNVLKVFEKLMNCYVHLEKWKEATEVVYQALVTVEGGLKQVMGLWTKLKKAAASHQDIFHSMTLNTVVKHAGKEVKGLSSKQLLIAEYQAWKLFSKRSYVIEYHILHELLDTPQTPAQKAEVMVALAATLCVTGYNPDNMSASEMLNKAIIVLDKNLVDRESSLAVACYTKYVLLHEETIEYMKNEKGDLEYCGKTDISENSRFTLQQEQENLPFLVRAIELWEKSLGTNQKSGNRSCDVADGGQTETKKSDITEVGETMFGLDHHIDSLIQCGTRLIAMKQPQLALRALEVAKDQLLNLKDSKRALDLSMLLSRALMLLGRYTEAESVVDGKGDNKTQTIPLSMSLILSELYMLTGKRDKGLEILQSVLDSNELLGKTQKVYLTQGTAKRLLSKALCLPDTGHMIRSANQYLLSLAFEAVQCHLTVINYLTGSKALEQNADKWMILNEVLSSMLHLCQLCRFVGLPREALCYLKAGLNISQGQGLPRWSCEFLMETLGVQSMEAESEKALLTAESINYILSTENQSKNNKLNQSRKGSKSDNQSSEKISPNSFSNESENFGFQTESETFSMKINSDNTEKTPERVYVKKELNSEKKNKLRRMKVPDCTCMVVKNGQCFDMVRHRLCMKAGIVFSDFLAQTDMRSIADDLLSEVQSKFKGHTSRDKSVSRKFDAGEIKNYLEDPQMLYSYLEASCIQAESYLHQRDFQKIHQIWKTFQELEQAGSFRNVVHSNILLTRLALCDASGYMLSLHGTKSEAMTKVDQSQTGSRVSLSFDQSLVETAKKTERLSLNPNRKKSLENVTETMTVTGTSVKKVRKKLARFAEDTKTPLKSANCNTPKLAFSVRKSRNLATPSTNRMGVLEKLMASDEEDDMIVFPDPKPVTPKIALKSSKTSRTKAKSRTEPRNPVCKKPAFVIAEDQVDDNKVACKLDFQSYTSEDIENQDVDDLENKPRKQVPKRKSSVVSFANDSEDHTDENAEHKNSKGKSKILKTMGKRSALGQAKRVGKSDSNKSDESFDVDTEKKTDKVLLEKKSNDNNDKHDIVNGHHNQFKGDVFDFEMEASPLVDNDKKPGKGNGKSKVSQRGKKVNVTRKAKINAEKNKMLDDDDDDDDFNDKENNKAPKARRTTRRGQTKKESKDTELVRKNCDSSGDSDREISIEEILFDNDSDQDSFELNESKENSTLELKEPMISKDWSHTSQIIDSTIDDILEPIEIMRGKTVAKSKTKKVGSSKTKADDNSITDQVIEGNSSGEDGHNTSRTVEQMRSGRLTSLNDMVDILDPENSPGVSCIEMPLTGGGSPCGADIIPTLHSLYERLCLFPPNPQHTDVCHILAQHYLDTDPRRAAFLLSDAMAVTFRHQVMLNVAKKARREAKEHSSAAGRTTNVPTSIMFCKDDLKLTEMLRTIPEDWCVVQLSVVSVGLPWKQMILTRFVKDKDPVVIKLPGFSSPQGCHILKDFSLILERNAETSGITSTAEWWNTRRKLDNDMENVVDRMEKHWLAHWRCAVLPGQCPNKVLDLVCKEISKIVQKDIKMVDIELLLLACKVLSEKELGQCVSDIVGTNIHGCHGDSIISVLKKYSGLAVSRSDKQHTVLILDKTIQHLPWESIPILSDRSVSRMPCLSHLVIQLADHHAQENSVFIKGVNPKNTFYILNPDSNLPRTQEFFKDWFESEKHWTGVIGSRPTSEQFIGALTNKDFFIYCGHGSGGRIFASDDIEKLTARAVTMLMGCSSGRLLVKGQFEPSGMMISYFLAGCPSMVANLWDVTDKDIDKFTEEVIKKWMASTDGTYLTNLVQQSRAICKLKYINGLAPVVYGLPVFINKGKK